MPNTSICIVVILNGKYMNGSQFSEPRYMNGVGFEISGRTFVPNDPQFPPPPHPADDNQENGNYILIPMHQPFVTMELIKVGKCWDFDFSP